MPEPLRIGRISYLNLLPIFMSLEDMRLTDRYEIIEGYPSQLNRMLRDGELDISPSSSIEFLRDRASYQYLRGHSISSRGAIRSILMFSRVPIEDLAEHEIMVTHQSETSVALLRVILGKFYAMDCSIRVTDEPFYEALRRHSAYLTIGDDALRAIHGASVLDVEKPGNCHAICSVSHQVFYVYDMGELWKLNTGLPSVYALWTYRQGLPEDKLELIGALKKDLDEAVRRTTLNMEELAARCDVGLPAEYIVSFWKGITYGLPEDCLEGLELFDKYLHETGILP